MKGKNFAVVRAELGRRYLVMTQPVDTPQWTIAQSINLRSLTSRVDTLMWYFYAALAVMIALFLRYNALFFAQIVNPIKADRSGDGYRREGKFLCARRALRISGSSTSLVTPSI